jgi:hypothetical protein
MTDWLFNYEQKIVRVLEVDLLLLSLTGRPFPAPSPPSSPLLSEPPCRAFLAAPTEAAGDHGFSSGVVDLCLGGDAK